ncbi:MAG: quinolinate synthase NadA [Nitrospinae bacterium]|nr:quinolinate synthase NadA [Nitrospinota bacterium]
MERFKELSAEIDGLRKKRNAVILAHNYQRGEVQDVADHCGDSLALSQIAAESPADVIVFCGVHFMAESAAILAPRKTVLLPNPDAGCPMADMITAEKLREKKKEMPGVPVVCYVNSSADVKAESDICCTSANAVRVVESLAQDTVYMVPDMNLSQYVAARTKKKLSWWKGFCPTHQLLTAKEVAAAKAQHPGAPFVAHPECPPDVLALADDIRSTSGMYEFARKGAAKTILVGTEMGILHRLKKENPDKEFILVSNCLICPNMKITTLEDVRDALLHNRHVIRVEEPALSRARTALERMLAVPRD